MAKKKATTSDKDLFLQIAAATGGEVLSDMASVKYFVDTGNLAVNYQCSGKYINGGLPGGRITEIYGPSSSGKSLFANNVLHGCQKLGGIPMILDCENATNNEFMERANHLNLDRVLWYAPTSLEGTFRKMHTVAKEIRKKIPIDVPIVAVYDSISVSPCERELKENDLPEDYKASDWKKIVGRKEQPGERARVCGNELRKLQAVLGSYNITVVVINQIREKIGMMFGNPETTGGGGKSLEFYCSCRLRTQAKKKIENKKLATFAGINLQVKNIKNKTHRPFIVVEDVKLYFESGIDPLTGLLQSLRESKRIEMVKENKFKVMPEYAPDDKEYIFTAKLTKNSIPMDVVLDCPKLIDAESREEVEEYLTDFQAALASSGDSSFSEKELAFSEDGEFLEGESEDEE